MTSLTSMVHSNNCTGWPQQVQQQLDETMPWVGMYITAASAVCVLAMAADAAIALCTQKLWIPCKYFRLNAFSLTLLAVTTKLQLDYTTIFYRLDEKLARCASIVLMSTAIGNFATSLGTLEDQEILLGVSALCVLVVTVAGNLLVRLIRVRHFWDKLDLVTEEMVATLLMFPLLMTLCSSAIMVPAARRCVESKYQEMHSKIVHRRLSGGEMKLAVKKYWVMAETGNLQFVIARSETSVVVGVLCVMMAFMLLEAIIRLPSVFKTCDATPSKYKWSARWILITQGLGVALGTIAPSLRLFMTARFKPINRAKDKFNIESYWIQSLVDWRESPVPLEIRHRKLRKLVHDAKGFILNAFIRVQVANAVFCKVILFIVATFLDVFVACVHRVVNFEAGEQGSGIEPDLRHFVLLLEGEMEFAENALKKVYEEMDNLIWIGKRKSKNLAKLLLKSRNLNNMKLEPSNCWSLLVVTLTSIALAISDTSCDTELLLSGVGEGLGVVKIIEANCADRCVRDAANAIWAGIDLYGKWLDEDILGNTNVNDYRKKLQELSNAAFKNIVINSRNIGNDSVRGNPTRCPVEVIAANYMNRIVQMIILDESCEGCRTDTAKQLFDRISSMIADTFVACFATNLENAIILKCHGSTIPDRERNIREAAVLLGESEEIFDALRRLDVAKCPVANKTSDDGGWRGDDVVVPPSLVTNMEIDIESPFTP